MTDETKRVPSVVIHRLPRYYRYLGDLLAQGIDKISSTELSVRMGVTASQIRQDFNFFGGFGQQGYGYNIEHLYNEIAEILRLKEGNNVIVIGAGNLGRALANHPGFERRGFKIAALFDISPDVIGMKINGMTVMDTSELENYIKNNTVDICVLTMPKAGAIETAKRLVECGVRAILNFSYAELDLPDGVAVENVHLSDPLMTLSYQLREMETEGAQ